MKKVSIHIRALTICLAATILSSCAGSDQSSSISASFPDSQAASETSSSASNKNLGSIEDDVPSNEITLGKALQISGKSTRANSKALADNEIQVADQSEQLYPLVYGNNTILFEEMVYDANGSSFTLYKYNVNEGALSQIGNYAYDYRYENGTILDDRYYFRAPCVVDDGGNLIVQWQKIDCNTGEMEIVYSETVQSLYTFQKSCDNDQIYLMVDAVRGDTYTPTILSYSISTDECRIIYQAETNQRSVPFEKKRPWVYDVSPDQIAVMQIQQRSDEKYVYSMLILDRDGNRLREFEISALTPYSARNCNPFKLETVGNTFFTRIYDPQEEPPTVAFDGKGNTISFPEDLTNYPDELLWEHQYKDVFLFSTLPDNCDFEESRYSTQLYLFFDEEAALVPLEVDSMNSNRHDFWGNSLGDILVLESSNSSFGKEEILPASEIEEAIDNRLKETGGS